ncbi:MAG: hypothetical protein Q7S88_03040 [Candidatus Daviesbacteria bacterium]|nr:hypothetical protein [Candidatus Daviesbacteria bacterium]
MLEFRGQRGFYITGRDTLFDTFGQKNIVTTAFGYPNPRGFTPESLFPPISFSYHGDLGRARVIDFSLRYAQDGVVIERRGFLKNSVPFQLIKRAVRNLEDSMGRDRGALLLNAAVNSGVLDNPDLSPTEQRQFVDHFEKDYLSGELGLVAKRWVDKLIGKEVLIPVPHLNRYYGRLIDQSDPHQVPESSMDFPELFSNLNAEEALSLIPVLR